MNLEKLIYHFGRSYDVTLDELKDLSPQDLKVLIKRFSYRMSILLKYQTTNRYFIGRLPFSRGNTCYYCQNYVFPSDVYESVHGDFIRGFVEQLCEDCFEGIKNG